MVRKKKKKKMKKKKKKTTKKNNKQTKKTKQNITKTSLFKYTEHFNHQKMKIFRQKFGYFSYFWSKHRFEAVLTSTHNLCFDQK